MRSGSARGGFGDNFMSGYECSDGDCRFDADKGYASLRVASGTHGFADAAADGTDRFSVGITVGNVWYFQCDYSVGN